MRSRSPPKRSTSPISDCSGMGVPRSSGIIVDGAGERQIVNFRGSFPEEATWLPLDEVAQASAVLADPRWIDGAIALFGKARAPRRSDGARWRCPPTPRCSSGCCRSTDHAVFSEPAHRCLCRVGRRCVAEQAHAVQLPCRGRHARQRRGEL